MNPWALIVQTVVTVLGAAGLREIITAVLKRKAIKVEVAERVNEMSIKWADNVQKSADAALAKAARLEHSYDELNQKFQDLRVRFWDMEFKLRVWKALIMNPRSTLEDIRGLVTAEQGNPNNGGGPV